jgi:hypothetical protein
MEILPVAVGDALTREEGQVVRVEDRDEEESKSEERSYFFQTPLQWARS